MSFESSPLPSDEVTLNTGMTVKCGVVKFAGNRDFSGRRTMPCTMITQKYTSWQGFQAVMSNSTIVVPDRPQRGGLLS